MHENRRYVKLTKIAAAAASALAFPTGAHGEVVTPAHGGAVLAVAPNGTPYVAYAQGCALHVARRTPNGWRDAVAVRCLPLPLARLELVAARVDSHGRISVLADTTDGAKIVLVRQTAAGFRAQTLVDVTKRPSSLGWPGLALDARGSPVVAYVVRMPSRKTYLRLVRVDRRGRLTTSSVTRLGFPPSYFPPSAAPVLVEGRIHVVETFAAEGIEWLPQGRTWLGQYLFASFTGSDVGPVYAAASGADTWVASTMLQPQLGESDVLLTLRSDTETTDTLFTQAEVAGLAIPTGGVPEVAANESVPLGKGSATAALLVDATGSTTELDGRIAGYDVDASGARHILLATDRGLEWFTSPARPAVDVELTAEPTGGLSGRVAGASGGAVELYRERAGVPRVLVATAPLAADGSFLAHDGPPASPTLYRAVYRDPATGIPFASLTATPVG